ncbi:hypothetical protein HanRHA438_Chr01g0010821 [Helianthus annuus]|nr:hypothetical protein HanRHA438_Chr01g0010821 [Helianthus annuus]
MPLIFIRNRVANGGQLVTQQLEFSAIVRNRGITFLELSKGVTKSVHPLRGMMAVCVFKCTPNLMSRGVADSLGHGLLGECGVKQQKDTLVSLFPGLKFWVGFSLAIIRDGFWWGLRGTIDVTDQVEVGENWVHLVLPE